MIANDTVQRIDWDRSLTQSDEAGEKKLKSCMSYATLARGSIPRTMNRFPIPGKHGANPDILEPRFKDFLQERNL